MLLVVAESSGSSPGRQGFKMVVASDELYGSIGGGMMEVKLVEEAKLKLQNLEFKIDSELTEQVHRKNSSNRSGMICSGKQIVIFRKLTKYDLRTVCKIVQYLKNNRSRYLQITENKFQVGWHKQNNFDFRFTVNNPYSKETYVRLVSDSDDKNVTEKIQADNKIEINVSDVFAFLYEEKLGYKNSLFIIGGGHCALALSELMSKMDFHIMLFDDRADLNTFAKNEFAHTKQVVQSYMEIDEFISSGANHFVVVMTLGYKSDEVVIRRLLDKNFKYFGVLGSEAKMATLFKQLKKEGFSEEKLNQIRTPIGLSINSRTPEEIAVSIAAEIIQVKNKAV
jgi:xanthine dehydrogenase accessory factor